MRALICLVATVAIGSTTSDNAVARVPGMAVSTPADTASPLMFFSGHWSCAGGTPAGRVLLADVLFTPTMNAHWLESRHVDRPPGRYESISLWSLDPSSDSATGTVVYDNFGGARRFTSRVPIAGTVVWTRDTTEAGARMETFTYRRVSDSTYWYAWHVRREPGKPIVLGDSATCRRS